MVDVLLGLQWGDEGKGKIVDFLAPKYNIIARFQGGPNAGHTLYINGEKRVLHTIPSGIYHDHCTNFIGNGVVIDPITLKRECEMVMQDGIDLKNKLIISDKAHIILPTHKALDKASEIQKGQNKIGSTLKGIGPTYMDKTGRNGLRIGDLHSGKWKEKLKSLTDKHIQLLNQIGFTEDLSEFYIGFEEAVDFLKSLKQANGVYFINEAIEAGEKILAEGAQGTMLDIDFGTYPFVTSSNTITAGVCTGLGIAPQKINDVIGITKAYCTRVGSGPFPTELHDESGDNLRKIGNEFGATTGRPRRCGWIDLVALRYACLLNGVNKLCITKTDILDQYDNILVCDAYEIDDKISQVFPYDINQIEITPKYRSFEGWMNSPLSQCQNKDNLPSQFISYKNYLETFLSTRITYVSNGPGREEIIEL